MRSGPYKILYVEDDPMNRQLVSRVLSRAGYIVLEAQDGLSGIQTAARELPDLILMDIMLPGMDGYQVTTRLKSMPELANTPIVALTAKSIAGTRERALIAGCDGYIAKPIDIDDLRSQVAAFLKGKREEIAGGAEERLTLQQAYTQELVAQLEEKVRELESANVKLRHTDELKSKFIGMASHELKTPLAVIQGHFTIARGFFDEQDTPLDPTLQLSLDGIDKGIERLKAIIEDMLDVTRIEGQALSVHRKPVIVKEVVLSAVRKLKTAAQQRQLTVELAAGASWPVVLADTQRLSQVFLNLLSNAIKYTPDGGHIRISGRVISDVELARRSQSPGSLGRFAEIVFEDSGIGIDPEEKERIFELFYEVRDVSLHSTSKTGFMGSGLGLGLAIARGIVAAHGGFLWVESEGHDRERCPGSRFHVLLPVED